VTTEIKSLAARVLPNGIATEDEIKQLAAYVLGDFDDRRTSDTDLIDIPGDYAS